MAIFDFFTGKEVSENPEQQSPSMWDGIVDSVGSGMQSVGEGLKSGLAHTFERLQDPEFQAQLQVMGGALSNSNEKYQTALNSYEKRRSEIAKQKREDMQRAQAREEKLADLKEGRQYSEQQEYLKNFTPESVQAFRESGDQSVLVKNPVKAEFRTAEGKDGHTYRIQIDPITGMDVEGGIREVVDYAAPKAPVRNADWVVSGKYMYNKRTGELRPLEGGEDGGNSEPVMRTTSGGKPIPAGYDEDGNLYYQSSNPEFVTDANGAPLPVSSVGKLDMMDPTKRQKMDKEIAEQEAAYQAPAKAAQEMADTADKLLKHEGLDNAYGVLDAKTPTLRQSTADAEVLRDQLSGQVFLSQRQQLKGQGQITDYESKRAEEALTIATNPRSSAEAVRKALNELKELNTTIQGRVSKGVDVNGNPVKHRRQRDPLAKKQGGIDPSQVQIRRN